MAITNPPMYSPSICNRRSLTPDDSTPLTKRRRHSPPQPATEDTNEAQDSSFEEVLHPTPPSLSPDLSPIPSSSLLNHQDSFPRPTLPSLEYSDLSIHQHPLAQRASQAPSLHYSNHKASLGDQATTEPSSDHSAYQEAIEVGQSPRSSYTDSSSEMPPAIPLNCEDTRQSWKKNNHFYNAKGARERGAAIISLANEILDDQRASPTAEEKIHSIHAVSELCPIKGEDKFLVELEKILFNKARMVRKPGIPSTQHLTINDYEAEPRAWKEDFLGTRIKGPFRKDSLPQPKDRILTELPSFYPKMEIAVPDVTWGLDETLLPAQWKTLFDNYGPKQLGRQLFFPFLTADLKTRELPAAEAENQCMRAGSSMVWNLYQLNTIYSDSQTQLPDISTKEVRSADPNTDTSTPDPKSIAFTVALTPNHTTLHVHWLEIWSNGAIYHHTTPLRHYSLQYGFDDQTRDFQRHLSNVLDWGLLKRTPKISKKARKLAQKRFREDYDLPIPEPKRREIRCQ